MVSNPRLSMTYATTGGTANTACDILFDDTSTSSTRFDRFYVNFASLPPTDVVLYNVYDNNSADTVAQLQLRSTGVLSLKDRFTEEDTVNLAAGTHRMR